MRKIYDAIIKHKTAYEVTRGRDCGRVLFRSAEVLLGRGSQTRAALRAAAKQHFSRKEPRALPLKTRSWSSSRQQLGGVPEVNRSEERRVGKEQRADDKTGPR